MSRIAVMAETADVMRLQGEKYTIAANGHFNLDKGYVMDFELGAYAAKGNIRVRCGWSNLGLVKGATVEATQLDKENKKVLVRYRTGSINWMSLNKFKDNFEIVIGNRE